MKATEIKRGMVLNWEGDLWNVIESNHVTPGNWRGMVQVTMKSLKGTNNAKLMHCLPVRRNVELGADVLDGPHSLVTAQASNRIWAAQAVLGELLRSKK